MGDIDLHQYPVPLTRSHCLQVEDALLLHLLNAVKEAVVIVRRVNWTDKVSPPFHMPQIQGHMILIMLEVWKKGCFLKGSDEK